MSIKKSNFYQYIKGYSRNSLSNETKSNYFQQNKITTASLCSSLPSKNKNMLFQRFSDKKFKFKYQLQR